MMSHSVSTTPKKPTPRNALGNSIRRTSIGGALNTTTFSSAGTPPAAGVGMAAPHGSSQAGLGVSSSVGEPGNPLSSSSALQVGRASIGKASQGGAAVSDASPARPPNSTAAVPRLNLSKLAPPGSSPGKEIALTRGSTYDSRRTSLNRLYGGYKNGQGSSIKSPQVR